MKQQKDKMGFKRGEFVAQVVGQRALGVECRIIALELSGEAARCFAGAQAGQFVNVACRELDNSKVPAPLLRRPFSIAWMTSDYTMNSVKSGVREADDGSTSLEIVYRPMGTGTRWLERRCAGDRVNLLGPLGNGFTLPAKKGARALLLGGGVGLPPMFLLAGQLAAAGIEAVGFAGARTKTTLAAGVDEAKYQGGNVLRPRLGVEQFGYSGTAAVAATDDGSLGFGGSVVEAAEKFLETTPGWEQAMIYACGPKGMLRAAAEVAERRGMSCQVCMEAYMACGIGVCQSCVVPTKSETGARRYKLVCSNGPVFDAESIVWE